MGEPRPRVGRLIRGLAFGAMLSADWTRDVPAMR